jgi:hypothetical protein
MSGYEAAGLVFGVVQVLPGRESGGRDGFAWSSDSCSYTVDHQPVVGYDVAAPAAIFTAHTSEAAALSDDVTAASTFLLHGTYADQDRPPGMADCRMVCSYDAGWDAAFGLSVHFGGLPTAVGTADDPRLRFECHAELRAAGDLAGCQVDFLLEVNRFGEVDVVGYDFGYGQASVTAAGLFQLHYELTEHGG